MIFNSLAFVSSCLIYYLLRRHYVTKFTQPQRELLSSSKEKAKMKPIPCAGIVFFIVFAIYSLVQGQIDYKFFTLLGFFLIGLLDDVGKIWKKSHISFFSGKWRILVEIIISTFFIYNLLNGESYILIVKDFVFVIPLWFAVPILAFIIIGTANAVNLTDGQDALAGKVVLVNLFFLLALFGINGSILLLIFLILAFLLFNTKPATIYMGDSGSLFLGAFLAIFFITHKIEAFLPVTGIVFVLEALSVILQVCYFKLTKRRMFKMSPLHHHFELLGVSEEKTVNLAFVVTILASFAAFFVITL